MRGLIPEPNEFYTTSVNQRLTSDDYLNLVNLYLPVIGPKAFALYLALVGKSLANDFAFPHAELFKILELSGAKFVSARERLEGVLLLETFLQETFEFGTEYFYRLKLPLTSNRFFAELLFSGLLLFKIGQNSFDNLVKNYQETVKDTRKLENISKKFSEIYRFDLNILNKEDQRIREACEKVTPKSYETNFNFKFFQTLMDRNGLRFKNRSHAEELLIAMHALFGLNEFELFQKGCDLACPGEIFDLEELKQVLEEELSAVVKIKSENTKEKLEFSDLSNLNFSKQEIEVIREAEKLAPIQYLSNIRSQKGGFIDTAEYRLLDELKKKKLPCAVINILINYVLIIQENSTLSRNYTFKIANDWVQKGMQNAASAISYIKKLTASNLEKSQQKRKKFSASRPVEKIPDFLEEEKNPQKISLEEVAKLQEELANISSFQDE